MLGVIVVLFLKSSFACGQYTTSTSESDQELAIVKALQNQEILLQNLKNANREIKQLLESNYLYMKNGIEFLKRYAICERHGGEHCVTCPPGFNYTLPIHHKCYGVVTDGLSWEAAQRRCSQLHPKGRLAIINNTNEQDIVSSFIANIGCAKEITSTITGNRYHDTCFWVGGQRQDTTQCNSMFLWKSANSPHVPITEYNWRYGEPNCMPGPKGTSQVEACIALFNSGRWNDFLCSTALCSICEVDI